VVCGGGVTCVVVLVSFLVEIFFGCSLHSLVLMLSGGASPTSLGWRGRVPLHRP
jgi:hypothetical protein